MPYGENSNGEFCWIKSIFKTTLRFLKNIYEGAHFKIKQRVYDLTLKNEIFNRSFLGFLSKLLKIAYYVWEYQFYHLFLRTNMTPSDIATGLRCSNHLVPTFLHHSTTMYWLFLMPYVFWVFSNKVLLSSKYSYGTSLIFFWNF